jgi:hypothetical protein
MKPEKPTIKQRFKDEYARQTMRLPKEESEPLTDEAWFIIILLLSIGGVIGFVAGVFLV